MLVSYKKFKSLKLMANCLYTSISWLIVLYFDLILTSDDSCTLPTVFSRKWTFAWRTQWSKLLLFGSISNSNWTEWSAIQGVIAQVISKSDEREAWGWFEITSTITPWIVRHEVQLLINRSRTNFGIKMSSKNFFWAKVSVALFLSLENCRKHC